ncbi:MAG: MATE family efflux transporter [Oscillospiraceae bacterium]|nr:MATE family efflux transporter [Clostridiales bacterium]MDY5594745.1 MATE family efflux transporter [Oscillospiraceae bacterium]MDY6095599.1 MATE family efflux transporter [Oscillospiraceae bacterium]
MQTIPAKENKMGTMPENKLLMSMAVPMMISMLVQALYNVVDSIFVSRICENALTAVSMAFPLQNVVISVSVGFGVGINALLSRALGQKNPERANQVAVQGLILQAISFFLVLLIGIFGMEAYMRTQTDIEEIVQFGTVYLRICLICSFGVFIQVTFERFLQATGRTIYSMITQLTGAIINIVFDPILIFGLLGFPKLGIAGAAWATVFGQCVGAVVAIILNHRKNDDLTLKLRHIRPDFHLMGEISGISIPSILMSCISSLTAYIMNLILITFSSTAVAVFGAYFKLQSFIFMPIFGLNNGMVPIIAYNYGAQRPDRIHKTIRLGMTYAVSIMLTGLLVFHLFPEALLSFFDASPDMIAIGVPALRIMSLAFVFAGICIISSSTCQALGYSIYGMLISFARQLVVLVPCALLLARTHVLNNVWFAFPIAEVASIIISLILLRTALRKTGMLKKA